MHRRLIASLGLVLRLARARMEGVTPHQQYSSSIGVPGCLIDTNRVAYFPTQPSCTEPCVRIMHPESERQLTLLHIDRSGGAYDISYDAWNYLKSGAGAKEGPETGAAVNMEIVPVALDDEQCQALLEQTGGKIPNMAISPNWVIEMCADMDKVVFYNFMTQSCTIGSDEVCQLDGQVMKCPRGVGAVDDYDGPTVTDIAYGTGEDVPSPEA
ncbi:hypothetical protein VUR80DRAFT_3622 [Thermomyces stellatus]